MTRLTDVKEERRSIVERYSQADDFTGYLQVANTLVPLALLWWLLSTPFGQQWWCVVAEVVLMALFSLRALVLMHECGHSSLFRSRRLNRTLGFLLGLVSAMPQYVWSQHHAFHHAHNGNWEKYRGPLTTPSVDEYAAMTAARQWQYRSTRHISAAPLGGFLYLIFNPRFTWLKGSVQWLLHVLRMGIAGPAGRTELAARGFHTRYWNSLREYRHMTANNIVLLCLWGLMCWALGPTVFFTFYLLTLSLAGGAGIVLFTVQHNFEHSYACNSADWDYEAGAIKGTSFLVLPAWLNWFTASIGYHHVHHLSDRIPNYRLAECHRDYQHLFGDVARLTLWQVPRALKCILWDQQTRRIISVAQYSLDKCRRQLPAP